MLTHSGRNLKRRCRIGTLKKIIKIKRKIKRKEKEKEKKMREWKKRKGDETHSVIKLVSCGGKALE